MAESREIGQHVVFTNCDVGRESDSGAAVQVSLDEGKTWHWIPISQIEEIHRNPKVRGGDEIKMTRWITEKKELL